MSLELQRLSRAARAAALFLAVAASAARGRAEPLPEALRGTLVFHAKQAGQYDVFATSDGGRTLRNLTAHPADDTAARLSPDGTRVAFQSSRAGRSHLFVVPLGGGRPTQLTSGPCLDESPAWSADSATIYFHSHRGASWRIASVGAAGGPVSLLTGERMDALCPVVSPGGSRLACQIRRDASCPWVVALLSLDGKVLGEAHAPGAGYSETPSFSPDGGTLFFAASTPGGYDFFSTPAKALEPARAGERGSGPQAPTGNRGEARGARSALARPETDAPAGKPVTALTRWGGWKLHPTAAGGGRYLLFDQKTPAGWKIGLLELASGRHWTLDLPGECFQPDWRDSPRSPRSGPPD